MRAVIVKEGAVLKGEFGASHCNQWGLCDALFSNYFEDLLLYPPSERSETGGYTDILFSVHKSTVYWPMVAMASSLHGVLR